MFKRKYHKCKESDEYYRQGFEVMYSDYVKEWSINDDMNHGTPNINYCPWCGFNLNNK